MLYALADWSNSLALADWSNSLVMSVVWLAGGGGPQPATSARPGYRTSRPVAARPMIRRWISDVPSKIVKILASRCQRSTG